jgi:hypothetical protein
LPSNPSTLLLEVSSGSSDLSPAYIHPQDAIDKPIIVAMLHTLTKIDRDLIMLAFPLIGALFLQASAITCK